MIWLRVLAGVVFLIWFKALAYTLWVATRPWKVEAKSKYGAVEPDVVREIDAQQRRSGEHRRY